MRKTILRCFGALLICLPLVAADYSTESAGAPPQEAPEATRAALQDDGIRAKGPDGKTVAEFWMRKTPFDGAGKKDLGVRYATIPYGAFLGVAHFPEGDKDFRGQGIPAGYYSMRYVLQPVDGNHYESTRDFALLCPVKEDTDVNANLDMPGVVAMSLKTGNPHVTMVHIELSEGMDSPNLWENDYGHEILDLKVAEEVVGFVIHGHAEE